MEPTATEGTATRVLDNYIAGAWTPSHREPSASRYVNPADGSLIAEVPHVGRRRARRRRRPPPARRCPSGAPSA